MTASDIIKRILGLIMLLVGLGIMFGSIFIATSVTPALEGLAESLDNTLAFTSDTLETARETIALTQDTITEVTTALDTAATATADLSQTVTDSRPFINNVTTLVSQDVPENIEAIQATLPNVIQVAAVIDSTLTRLASLGIDRTINLPFGQTIPLQFDLGIDYAPEQPFDQTIISLSDSLEGLPEDLRALEDDLMVTNDNLALLSDDLLAMSDDLASINAQTAELTPQLNAYVRLIDDVETSLETAQATIPERLEALQSAVMIGLVLLALSQLVSVFVGWELLAGRRDSLTPDQVEGLKQLLAQNSQLNQPAAPAATVTKDSPVVDAS